MNAQAKAGTHTVPEREIRWLSEAAKIRGEAFYLRGLERLRDGEPLAYVLGSQPFRDRQYYVTPGVLIPRPETEFVVEQSLEWLRSRPEAPSRGAEIGLGAGVISLELLHEFPLTLRMEATEISETAAAVAAANAGNSALRILRPHTAVEVLEPFLREGGKYDFLIMNPPYLEQSPHEVDENVLSHEPWEALFPEIGCDSLHFYREVAEGGMKILNHGGVVFCEIPHERAGAIRMLFEEHKWWTVVRNDGTERPRWLMAGTC